MTHPLLTKEITGASAWLGSDMEDAERWMLHLSADAIASIDAALADLEERRLTPPLFGKGDFPIGSLAGPLATIADELENGCGFFLLRGLPVERYDDVQIAMIYYGIGLHLGMPVGQNPQGDLIGTVMNVGDIADPNTRVFQTNAYLPYHTDPSDAVCLLCIRKARMGGLSSLVSAAAIHNAILREHPAMLGLYYRPYHYAHLRADGAGFSPIFSYHNGKLSCRYLRQYIELGHEQREQPLTEAERAALDLFDVVSQREEMRLDMMLEPGDMQFANNYAVLHSRSAFQDAEALDMRRKLLRLWLNMPNARRLAPDFPGRNGFEVHHTVQHVQSSI